MIQIKYTTGLLIVQKGLHLTSFHLYIWYYGENISKPSMCCQQLWQIITITFSAEFWHKIIIIPKRWIGAVWWIIKDNIICQSSPKWPFQNIPDQKEFPLCDSCTESGAPEHPGGAERRAIAPPHQEETVQAPGQNVLSAKREAPGASFINAACVLKKISAIS